MADRAGVDEPETTEGDAEADRLAASSTLSSADEAVACVVGSVVVSGLDPMRTGWARSLESEGIAGELYSCAGGNMEALTEEDVGSASDKEGAAAPAEA